MRQTEIAGVSSAGNPHRKKILHWGLLCCSSAELQNNLKSLGDACCYLWVSVGQCQGIPIWKQGNLKKLVISLHLYADSCEIVSYVCLNNICCLHTLIRAWKLIENIKYCLQQTGLSERWMQSVKKWCTTTHLGWNWQKKMYRRLYYRCFLMKTDIVELLISQKKQLLKPKLLSYMTAETVMRCVMVTAWEMLACFCWHWAFSWEISFSVAANHNQQWQSVSSTTC